MGESMRSCPGYGNGRRDAAGARSGLRLVEDPDAGGERKDMRQAGATQAIFLDRRGGLWNPGGEFTGQGSGFLRFGQVRVTSQVAPLAKEADSVQVLRLRLECLVPNLCR